MSMSTSEPVHRPPTAGVDDEPYFIWSNEHRAWWRAGQCGYTRFVTEAGRYSHRDAIGICVRATGGWNAGEPLPEIPVLAIDALDVLAATAGVHRGEAR